MAGSLCCSSQSRKPKADFSVKLLLLKYSRILGKKWLYLYSVSDSICCCLKIKYRSISPTTETVTGFNSISDCGLYLIKELSKFPVAQSPWICSASLWATIWFRGLSSNPKLKKYRFPWYDQTSRNHPTPAELVATLTCTLPLGAFRVTIDDQ